VGWLGYIIFMSNDPEDFLVQFLYQPTPDAQERLAQVWELIIKLILEDYKNEPEVDADREKQHLES